MAVAHLHDVVGLSSCRTFRDFPMSDTSVRHLKRRLAFEFDSDHEGSRVDGTRSRTAQSPDIAHVMSWDICAAEKLRVAELPSRHVRTR